MKSLKLKEMSKDLLKDYRFLILGDILLRFLSIWYKILPPVLLSTKFLVSSLIFKVTLFNPEPRWMPPTPPRLSPMKLSWRFVLRPLKKLRLGLLLTKRILKLSMARLPTWKTEETPPQLTEIKPSWNSTKKLKDGLESLSPMKPTLLNLRRN